MSFFVLTATLTTAGKTLIDNAKTNSQTVKVDRISFGDSTAALNASTTTIGNLIETAASITQATNLVMTRAEFQGLFRGAPAAKVGTIGVYSGTTLIGVVRFTMPTSTEGDTQIAVRLDYANVSVFAKTFTTVAASLLADTYKKAYDDSLTYLQNGAINSKRSLFGLSSGKEADWFCSFVNIFATQAEMNEALLLAPAAGTTAYYLQDSKKYVVNNGAWEVTPGAISDEVRPGRMYRSEITKSVYFARTSSDLLRVYKYVDMTADVVFTLTKTTTPKQVSMVLSGASLDYFFDIDPGYIRRSTSGLINIPVGAGRMYVRFVQASITPGATFGLTNNDVVESVFDWSTYPLSRIVLSNCTELVTVPGSYLPTTLTSLNSTFSGCIKFAPQIMSWDTSRITDFSYCFQLCEKLACAMPWNTAEGVDFSYMFQGCKTMNNGLNAWNMSKAKNLTGMLMDCILFNQPLDQWNVSACENFRLLFSGCKAFNRSINTWNVNYGRNYAYMFDGCSAFNQALNNWRPGYEFPDVSLDGMFRNAVAFNQPLNNWIANRIASMNEMFSGASIFNQNLSTWVVKATATRTDYDLNATAWLLANKPQFTGA